MATPMPAATRRSERTTRKKISVADVLDAIHGSDSEFDELSSDDSDHDGWPSDSEDYEVSRDKNSSEESDDNSSDDSADERPLSLLKISGHPSNVKSGTKPNKITYTFDEKKDFVPPPDTVFVESDVQPEPRDMTPYAYFKQFVDNDMLSSLATETNNYAHQKSGINLQVNLAEIEAFMGMYFHMGLVKMPAVGCFWETGTRYSPVADVMSRNRFQKITSYLHIRDNLVVTDVEKEDRAWKIRPWIDGLNSKFAIVSPHECQSIDEVMVAFKGRSLLKQYLPKKPKKWGFKLWARCSSTGFLHVFDLYQGKGSGMGTDDGPPECGLGGNVVLRLCSSLPENRNFKIFADNFFSNFSLVQELKQKGHLYVGTINANRLHGAPLKSDKELKKKGRGACDCVVETNRNVSVVRWFDNKCVTLVSSYLGIEPLDSVRRYDRSKKEHIQVDRPCIIGVYNKSMGGVDLLDMMCALYKYQLKSKRWYLYVFYHTLTIALVNAWFQYKRDCQILNVTKIMPLRQFQSHVAGALCASGKPMRGRPSIGAAKKRKMQVNPRPIGDIRLDGVDHYPSHTDRRQRCRCCPDGFSYVECIKCNMHLCLNKNRNCFMAYHSQ